MNRLPAVFFGHGNPLLTLGPNRFTATWGRIGAALPRPQAILCVSAHWYVRGSAVTAPARPRTIHDFRGFPPELYAIEYPAPGSPELAARVRELLAPAAVALDERWGLDHGTWCVLRHAYPAADLPVVQLAIDAGLSSAAHYELGARLRALRTEGVLIVGSGNVVHNLHEMDWVQACVAPYAWADEFAARVRERIAAREHAPLIEWESLGPAARRAVPTPEHYLPLLYVLALQEPDEPVAFATDLIEHGSIGMLSVIVGLGADLDAGLDPPCDEWPREQDQDVEAGRKAAPR